jgi:DNA gyrase subunit B
VKKGKVERYLKDEGSMEEFILELASENVEIKLEGGKGTLKGEKLCKVLKRVARFQQIVTMIGRRHREGEVVAALAMEDGFGLETLKDMKSLKAVLEEIRTYIEALHPALTPVEFQVSEDIEHDCLTFSASTRSGDEKIETTVDRALISSPDFQELRRLGTELKCLGDPPYEIVTDDGLKKMNTFKKLLDTVFEIGKKGLYLQRYKGLGEMNPGQLWETTMDPESRTLLQVRVEDVIEADDVFTRLMGDEVEPRREFIEQHALEVVNLDI